MGYSSSGPTISGPRLGEELLEERLVVHQVLDVRGRLDPARPVRLLGVRVAGLDEESASALPEDQLSLSL